MLSPTSLAGLSISPDWARPVRAVSPSSPTSLGASQSVRPLTPLPIAPPAVGDPLDGGGPSLTLPRGSLLDLSV